MDDEIIDGEADDRDPEVIAGMKRLAELRDLEQAVPDLPTGRPAQRRR